MHKKPSGSKDCRRVEANGKKLFFILSNLYSLLLDHKLQVFFISTFKIGSFHHQVLNFWYDIKSTQPLTMMELYNEYVFTLKTSDKY